ncbi:methyltransferase domain-containing protein [Acutalibacter muris]|uniref:methyltransferase domain-containing protein n=1 Tax=Acutalibacter muris TaxID=1796620 RepID=UPI0025B752FE|nr:class I SAM-dependent methyltransferase [Acutalibacter muris]
MGNQNLPTGNYKPTVRARRWARFMLNYIGEKLRGLDFSMVYVGDLQRNVEHYHGYSMTDEKEMRRILGTVPLEPAKTGFIDLGCGKGMCLKCAAQMGYKKVAGLELDQDLLKIGRRNMEKLGLDAQVIYGNAMEYGDYDDYDLFYFFNPFGPPVFEKVIGFMLESQQRRNRDIWAVYNHPVSGYLFEEAGFTAKLESFDNTRGFNVKYYLLPKRKTP